MYELATLMNFRKIRKLYPLKVFYKRQKDLGHLFKNTIIFNLCFNLYSTTACFNLAPNYTGIIW